MLALLPPAPLDFREEIDIGRDDGVLCGSDAGAARRSPGRTGGNPCTPFYHPGSRTKQRCCRSIFTQASAALRYGRRFDHGFPGRDSPQREDIRKAGSSSSSRAFAWAPVVLSTIESRAAFFKQPGSLSPLSSPILRGEPRAFRVVAP